MSFTILGLSSDTNPLYAVLLILFLVAAFYDGSIGRDKMRNVSHIEPGAEVVSCDTKQFGQWAAAHFELVVRFSDGSFYRTKIGKNQQVRHNRWKYSYNESDVKQTIIKAIIAHEEAARTITH